MADRPSRGRPKKWEGGTQVFSLRMPSDLHAEIRDYADTHHHAINGLLLDAIRAWWQSVPESRPGTTMRRKSKR